ncbi:MAG TPA: Gmad2 immunoglobulin-like domain-containing protein [Candidatus Paceibacterota bacterium]
MKQATKASTIIFLVIILFVIGSFLSLRKIKRFSEREVNSFISCVAAGLPVLESFPRKCTDTEGKVYIEEVTPPTNAITNPKVHVYFPTPGTTVSTPIAFSGEARGSWFFEGSFPVEVRNITGKTIAKSNAVTRDEWITEEFVSFEGDILLLPQTPSGPLFLVLKKDNSSGDPTKDEEVIVPVNYVGVRSPR